MNHSIPAGESQSMREARHSRHNQEREQTQGDKKYAGVKPLKSAGPFLHSAIDNGSVGGKGRHDDGNGDTDDTLCPSCIDVVRCVRVTSQHQNVTP